MNKKGDYIVYIDESGEHSLDNINKEYPIFVLSFCCFEIKEYVNNIVPKIQDLKFKYFGHDQIILHETDIRKNRNGFEILRTNRDLRNRFLNNLSNIIDTSDFKIFSAIIDKNKLKNKYKYPINPYHLCLRFGLEKLHNFFLYNNQKGKDIYLVFEKRGKNEDRDLELEFLRICNNESFGYKKIDFSDIHYKFLISDKKSNSCGLQFADLTARPIGLNYIKPTQENRSYDILENKIKNHKNFP